MLKPKTLTFLSLLLSLFFLCDFIDSFFFGIFFFTVLMAVLTAYMGLLKVTVLEATFTLIDILTDNPTKTFTSISPFSPYPEMIPLLNVCLYASLFGLYMIEILLFRFISRRYLPRRFQLGY